MDNTKKIFRAIDADAMLTSSADLRAYLTGFQSTFGFVYTDAQESVFFTDPRYAEAAKAALKSEFIGVEIAKTEETVFDYIKSRKVKRLAVPFERIALPTSERLRRSGFKLIDSMPAFTSAMSIKNADEILLIQKACSIAEQSYQELLGLLRAGMSENEVAGLLEYRMRCNGAENRSFETIVAFGKNSSVPHHAPCNDRLYHNMPVLFDFGCKYHGYCSDMTRTIWFGDDVDPDFRSAYEAVYGAHEYAIGNIRAGMTGQQADSFARDYLKDRGLDKFFTHSLGHGIGINIHESPTLGPSGKTILQENMVFSIEPGVYFEGRFGIRIEDSVRMLDGKVLSFMKAGKSLILL